MAMDGNRLGLSNAASNFVNAYSMGKQQKQQQMQQDKQNQIQGLMGQMLTGSAQPEQMDQLAQLDPNSFISAKNYLSQQETAKAQAADVLDAERDKSDLMKMLSTDEVGQNTIIDQRIADIEAAGGDASDSKYLRNLPADQRNKWLNMQAGQTGINIEKSAGADIGTYNPRDYTVDSFAEFVKTQDPSTLSRYAPMKQTVVGGITYFADDEGKLYQPVMQNEDGSVVSATNDQVASGEAKPNYLSADAQIQSAAELEGAKKTATTQAAADVAANSPEAQDQATKNEAFRVDTIDVIDNMLNSDYDRVTGTLGRLPTFMPKTEDILVQADRLESLLTAENMDIMTGVLSETDIKIISNLAGGFGLERNDDGSPVRIKGSPEAFKDRMETVKKGLHAVEIVPMLTSEIPDATEGMIVTDSETGYKFTFKNGKWVAK